MKILDFGCGNKKIKGAIGIDVNRNTEADVIADLNHFPYPLRDSSFDLIICDNILEHLNDLIKVMEELHRIAKPGAKIVIKAPYFRSTGAFQDPTHRTFITEKTFDYFLEDSSYNFYTKARFRIKKIEYKWGESAKIKLLRFILGDRIVRDMVTNACWGIEFELEVIK